MNKYTACVLPIDVRKNYNFLKSTITVYRGRLTYHVCSYFPGEFHITLYRGIVIFLIHRHICSSILCFLRVYFNMKSITMRL
jgi:hypothetical protein